jgi:hypothetical protein
MAVARLPVNTQFYTCDCNKHLDAKAAWKAVPAGTAFEISPGTVVSRETEYEALKSAGLTLLEGGRFKQGERIETLEESKRKAVAAGMCQAQCLHWIRRVLQKGRQVYDASRTKSNTTRSSSAAKNRELQQSNAVADIQMLGGVAYSEWDARAKQADEILIDSKDKEPENVKRLFANIKVTVHQPKQDWSSIDAFLNTLFQKRELSDPPTAAAAILLIDIRGSGEDGSDISAHAIAVAHDKRQRAMLLFDPNYGVFSAANLATLQRGTATLIKDVWTKFGKKPWKVANRCSYNVFAPAAQETPPPPVTIAAATVEVKGLAAQGKLPIPGPTLPPPSMEGPPPKPQKVVIVQPKKTADRGAKTPAPLGKQTAGPSSRGTPAQTEVSSSNTRDAFAKFRSLDKAAAESAKSKAKK